jgi:N-methylhydantoinase B
VSDTGGAGKYRGGLGIEREFRLLAEDATFQLRSDRSDFTPWGVQGGKPGTPTENYLNPGTDREEKLPGKTLRQLKKGDLYRVVQAGAGGYGDPLERDMYAVADDVEQEKLSAEYVRREYGVVIDPKTSALDVSGTEKLRGEMAAANN